VHLTVRRRTTLSSAIAAIAATVLVAAPASAAPAVPAAPAGGCPVVPTVQPFAAWNDVADYLPVPDGGLEAGGGTWSLQGGARVVEGNAPFQVGGASDRRSLELPARGSATTAPICIGVEHRTMRFFSASARTGSLRVEALYTTHDGRPASVVLGAVHGAGTWAPTDVLPMRVNEQADDFGNAMSVRLRFTGLGATASRIDDVYVDPYRMR
jgi:hypothetical protein